ncbi:g110 [Coccomyxa elongata]
MADASLDSQIEGLFSRLDAQLKNSQFKKALKVVDEILKISPGDKDAVHSKVIALIELSRFEEAVAVVDSTKFAAELAFEKAYSLFRLGSFTDALAALQSGGSDQLVAQLQLEAQLYYRMGRNSDAIRIYHQLFKDHKVSSLELRTNVLAAYVSGGRAHELPAVMEAMKISSKDSFEIAFNTACGLVAAGDFNDAQRELEHASRLGRETLLDEELTEEQVEEELAPVTVQLAYTAAQLGRTAEALSTYEGVMKDGIEDDAVVAVASNNWVAERLATEGDAAPKKLCAELLKKFESFFEKGREVRMKVTLERRLSQAQKESIYANYALLLLLAGRSDAAREFTASLMKWAPESERVLLVVAAQLARDGKVDEATSLLASSTATGCALMRAQLAIEAGDAKQASEALQQAGDAAWLKQPALVATQVAFLEALDDVTTARKLLEEAIAAQQSGKPAKAQPSSEAVSAEAFLYQSLAKLQLKAGEVAEAVESYEQAVRLAGKSAPGVYKLMGQLARRSAAGTGVAVDQLESSLPPLDPLPASRIDELEEAAGGSWAVRRRAAEGAAQRPAEDEAEARQKKKRKRRVRLPKGFDAANPGPLPNPERWLPKWQRSDFKKKRTRRKDKEAVKGSQGAGKVDEALDRSNVVTEESAAVPRAAAPQRNKKKGRR